MNPEPEAGGGFWRARLRSLKFAWRGIAELLRSHPNARIHLGATVVVIAAAFLLRVSRGEWAMLVLAMGLVWTAEALNTAVELLGERITTERDELVRRAKDVAAGAVLLASIAAAVTGILILGPRLWALLQGG